MGRSIPGCGNFAREEIECCSLLGQEEPSCCCMHSESKVRRRQSRNCGELNGNTRIGLKGMGIYEQKEPDLE